MTVSASLLTNNTAYRIKVAPVQKISTEYRASRSDESRNSVSHDIVEVNNYFLLRATSHSVFSSGFHPLFIALFGIMHHSLVTNRTTYLCSNTKLMVIQCRTKWSTKNLFQQTSSGFRRPKLQERCTVRGRILQNGFSSLKKLHYLPYSII